jgi:hypothetical protein
MPISQLPARQIDIHNTDHLRRIVAEIDNEQNRRRKRDAWQAFQVKNDNQKEYVVNELAALYPKTFTKFRIGNIKIAKKIVEKVSKAYKQAPIRKLVDDKETEELNDIYNKYGFHRAFKEADEIFNLHKYVFLWTTWQNPSEASDQHEIPIEEGRYVPQALAPYEYDLVRDQVSGEPLIFILSYPENTITRLAGRSDGIEQTISESQSDTSAQSMIYKLWTPTKFAQVEVKKAKGHGNDDNDDTMVINFEIKRANPLGRIPGTYLQADTAVDYPVKNDLAKTSIDWNVAFSDLKTASATQGHGQLVVSGPEDQKMKQLHMGMHSSIWLPQSKKPDAPPTEAQYISANPDLTGQLEVLKFDLSNILDDEGIKAKGTIEGGAEKFSSGFDRLVAEADVQDRVEDNQSLYSTTLEQGTYLTVKAHEEAMNQNTFKSDEIEVYFEKPKVLITDKEVRDNIKFDEENGLSLSHEKHMVLNPNLTEDQAKEREKEIMEEKKKRAQEMLEAMAGQEPGDEDEDNEEDIQEIPEE